MSAEHDAVIRKVRQLLALSRSTNEHEAQAAMLAADLLIQKHRLSEAQLAGATPGRIGSSVVTPRLIGVWRNALLSKLAKHYGCATIQDYDGAVKAWGLPDDLALLAVMYERLLEQVERLTVTHCTGKGRHYADSYRKGCVMAIYRLLDQAKAQASQGGDSTAIVRLDQREDESQQARDKEIGQAIVSRPKKVNVHTEAFQRGQRDGAHIHMGESLGDAVRAPKRLT